MPMLENTLTTASIHQRTQAKVTHPEPHAAGKVITTKLTWMEEVPYVSVSQIWIWSACLLHFAPIIKTTHQGSQTDAERSIVKALIGMGERPPHQRWPIQPPNEHGEGEQQEEHQVQDEEQVRDDAQAVELVRQLVQHHGEDACAHGQGEPGWREHQDASDDGMRGSSQSIAKEQILFFVVVIRPLRVLLLLLLLLYISTAAAAEVSRRR